VSKRILYIDDNPNDRRLIEKILTRHGYELIGAGDGPEGVKLATENCPDLILVDVQMPGLDGLETTRQLRQVEGCSLVPIVALTAYTEKYKREEYLEAGCTDYQQKQAGIRPLIDLVKRFLG
jgi:two-component system cell cycle response regulator DivK